MLLMVVVLVRVVLVVGGARPAAPRAPEARHGRPAAPAPSPARPRAPHAPRAPRAPPAHRAQHEVRAHPPRRRGQLAARTQAALRRRRGGLPKLHNKQTFPLPCTTLSAQLTTKHR